MSHRNYYSFKKMFVSIWLIYIYENNFIIFIESYYRGLNSQVYIRYAIRLFTRYMMANVYHLIGKCYCQIKYFFITRFCTSLHFACKFRRTSCLQGRYFLPHNSRNFRSSKICYDALLFSNEKIPLIRVLLS